MSGTEAAVLLLDRARRSAQGAAKALETGQARHPLTDRFDEIGWRLNNRGPRAVLLGLCTESRARALSWLSGMDCGTPLDGALAYPGLLEVQLNSGGRAPTGVPGRVPDSVPPLEARGLSGSEGRVLQGDPAVCAVPRRMALPCCEDVSGLSLAVPAGPESLAAPGAFTAMGPWLGLVVIVGHADTVLSGRERCAIAELASLAGACLPVVLPGRGSIPEGPAGLPGARCRWWVDRDLLKSRFVLPVLRWSASGPPSVPAFLTDSSGALHRAIACGPLLRSLRDSCELLGAEACSRADRLNERIVRGVGRVRGVGPPAQDPGRCAEADRLRLLVLERCAALDAVLQENTARAGTVEGPPARRAGAMLNSLGRRGLVLEKRRGTIGLTFADGFVDGLESEVFAGLMECVRRDSALLRDGLDGLRRELAECLADPTGAPALPELPALDEEILGAQIRGRLRLECHYEGELPEASLLRSFGDTRQIPALAGLVLSGVVAAAGLFGGSVLFPTLGAIGLTASSAYSLAAWRRARGERIEKEVGRVRELLGSEVERATEDPLGALADRLHGLVEGAQHRFLGWLGEGFGQTGASRIGAPAPGDVPARVGARADQARRRTLAALVANLPLLLQSIEEAEAAWEADLAGVIGREATGMMECGNARRD